MRRTALLALAATICLSMSMTSCMKDKAIPHPDPGLRNSVGELQNNLVIAPYAGTITIDSVQPSVAHAILSDGKMGTLIGFKVSAVEDSVRLIKFYLQVDPMGGPDPGFLNLKCEINGTKIGDVTRDGNYITVAFPNNLATRIPAGSSRWITIKGNRSGTPGTGWVITLLGYPTQIIYPDNSSVPLPMLPLSCAWVEFRD